MALWFECKIRFDKMMDNGVVKKVNEPYLVDALTFTEAETRIIEAMKLMNEIPAEVDGTVVEICVSNGQVVEYNQPLFRVAP